MKSNVLVVYYSQSGQLKEIVDQTTYDLIHYQEIKVSTYKIEMEEEFPFPWNFYSFFNAFPESFLQKQKRIKPIPTEILNQKYDLILLYYQVWFLSPSIPINSFLKDHQTQQILENTKVITISGSRNMWFLAQEKIKDLLKKNNATLTGNIALVDHSPNLISAMTIVNWMFSGVKKRMFNLLPLPGISQKTIEESRRFGKIILTSIQNNNYSNLQEKLVQSGAVTVKPFLISVDKKGNRMFKIWSKIIETKEGKQREKYLKFFYYYLILAIWILSPIVNLLYIIFYPFNYFKYKKQVKYFQGIE
ncbi:dialkylresorcinol condensing enzyme DarA [Empedobacter brevis]|uniref:dialkylrecorsinol condensing enzyme DarA n=1 Tax=Empedobacter brevis TaxID=247 RepID=UPI00123DC4EC|nr:dialkylrecorsinol condensing enzyme DarA [Empedobacter brevis]QES94240.1 dialkylresorcinol condensing enzyme DarA [Empedobacter brevis]